MIDQLNYLKTILSERLNRISGTLICREEISQAEYQYWFDRNPKYTHEGNRERIRLIQKLNEKGSTNDVYLAKSWLESSQGKMLEVPKDIVVKISIPYVPPGPMMHQRLNMIHGAFLDEVRINNMVRSTNIEGVIRPLGGGQAGRVVFFRMEYLKGDTLENAIYPIESDGSFYTRLGQMAYLANTISQLHHYQIVHMDLKPKNLFLCNQKGHKAENKILIFDFGFSSSQLRDTVTEYGGLLTPIYSAPEQALMARNLSRAVDYFSFGVILHEYLTGKHLFPESLNIFINDGYMITKNYLDYLRHGRKNLVQDPEVREIIDQLTIFDSIDRIQNCPDLYTIAHKFKDLAEHHGSGSVSTTYLRELAKKYNQNSGQ